MLACAAVPLYVGYVLKHLLTVLGKQGYEVLGLTLGLLANGAVAVWAIPRWGAFGAAVAISISQTVFCIVGIAVISSHHPLRMQVKPLLRAMPVLSALALAVWLACQSPWWPLFMAVAWLGAMSMLVGLKVLDPAELRKYLAAGRQEREAT